MLNPFIHKGLQERSDSPEPQRAVQTKQRRGRPTIDYPSTQTPTMIDVVRVAQFFEDEGHIRNNGKVLTVQIGQNDRTNLDWAQIRFGGRVYGPYINMAGNDTYCLTIVRERALGFMFTIFTYLTQSRRNQFKAVLRGEDSKREYQQTISDKGISEAFLNRKLSQHLKSKNKTVKGPMKLFGVRK